MATIRTRSAKGSELTHAELDGNFDRDVQVKTTTYACLVSDNRSILECIHASVAFTVTLGDAATMSLAETGDYEITIANIGAAVVTVARAGSDTIDGAATSVSLPQNSSVTLKVNAATDGYNSVARGLAGLTASASELNYNDGLTSTTVGITDTQTLSNKSITLLKLEKGADIASAAALTVGNDGNYFDITGTTAITSIVTKAIGTVIKLHFDGILTLTNHATNLILPGGANITTAAGDEAEFIEYASGDWRCTAYTPIGSAPNDDKIIPYAGSTRQINLDSAISLSTGLTKTLAANLYGMRVQLGNNQAQSSAIAGSGTNSVLSGTGIYSAYLVTGLVVEHYHNGAWRTDYVFDGTANRAGIIFIPEISTGNYFRVRNTTGGSLTMYYHVIASPIA